MFKVFKIDIFHKEIIFSSILMSGISYTLRVDYNVAYIDVLVQIILMIVFVWLLFRIHIFYSIIMTIMIYQAYMLIQSIYYYTLGYSLGDTLSIYFLQVISAITVLGIGWFLAKKRRGFDFVPDSPTYKVIIARREKILFILVIPALIILTSTMYFTEHFSNFYVLMPIVYGCILFSYIILSYKKDMA